MRLVGDGFANRDKVLSTVACIATLVGPLGSVEQARAVLVRTPGLGGQPEATLDGLAAVFASLYPGAGGEPCALPPVQPDRIGERLVATQLASTPSLADLPFEGSESSLAEQALRVLGRAARWQPGLVPRLEALARRHTAPFVRAWLAVAPEESWAPTHAERLEAALGGLEAMTPDEADALARPLPLGSVALRGVAVLLAERAAEGTPTTGTWESATPDELAGRARRLRDKGSHLSEVGRREEALASTGEAVKLYRKLAAARPDAFEPDLASSLNNLGTMQSAVGQREEALASTGEAVKLYRKLAAARPDAFEPDLASSLNNLGSMQSAVGQRRRRWRRRGRR
ncbi:tetratricopeptide repeat protein [Nannocystis sp.]|uniref:tetratricopeptide repeat protein n=1 Tax=Nannocystis sp. TaxID=1962667 RepID=UPI0025ED9301|nr:tetratricopeptide repeat protein [Nannocystis sp.]